MKQFLLFAAAALLCSASCFTAPLEYSSSHIGIELQNKMRRPLWIGVVNGDKLYQATYIKEADVKGLKKFMPTIASASLTIDINKPTKLAVWYKDPARIEYGKQKLGGLVGKEVFIPTPNRLYSFAPGKTIYLTWDPSDFPRPQTGKRGGSSGETESHRSLKNNVEPTDIKEETV